MSQIIKNKQHMKKIFLLLISLFLLGCEQKPPHPTDLYASYSNSVVLIKNSCYFKASLNNGFDFFYIIDDHTKKPIFFSDEKEAIKSAGVSYGTGFFISQKGELATNRHVVYPDNHEKVVRKEIEFFFTNLRADIKKGISEKRTEQSELVELWDEYYEYLDLENKSKIKKEFSTKKEALLELKQSLNKLDFNPEHTVTELKHVFLGVAFDGTYVVSDRDFKKCTVVKKSNAVDLAIVQLDRRRTPKNVKRIFTLKEQKDLKIPKLNDHVYMIGFNHGISLANTGNGIKSQFTQGKITQEPDHKRVLYSIPTLLGSSGSPIIDKWGNLVAVNYAKISNFQGFSFGVPHEALTQFYNKPMEFIKESPSRSLMSPKIASQVELETSLKQALDLELKEKPKLKMQAKERVKPQKKPPTQFHTHIQDFLIAEEHRDFDKIFSFLSPKFTKFFNVDTTTYSELKNYYEYVWKTTSDSRNYVKSIHKINEYTYELKTDYKYYDERVNKGFTDNNVIRFLFDTKGKIMEVYGIKQDSIHPVDALSQRSKFPSKEGQLLQTSN